MPRFPAPGDSRHPVPVFRSQRVRSPISSRKIPQFTHDIDTPARKLWRDGHPPVGTFRCPLRWVPSDLLRIEAISFNTNTHLVVVQERDEGRLTRRAINIWGTVDQVDDVKVKLTNWVAESVEGFNGQRHEFSGRPISTELADRLANSIDSESRRQRWRKAPPADVTFEHMICLKWPETTWALQEALGSSFEALDQIRMQYHCHITYLRQSEWTKPHACFQFLGNNEASMREAVLRLKNISQQVFARQDHRPVIYLIKPVFEELRQQVKLVDYVRPKPVRQPKPVEQDTNESASHGKSLILAGSPLTEEQWETRSIMLEEREALSAFAAGSQTERHNQALLEATTLSVLNSMQYYRGNMQLRVRFGTGVLNKYMIPKDDKLDIDTFEDMFTAFNKGENQMEGFVSQELGDRGLEEKLLGRFRNASNLFVPEDAMTTTLAEIRPIYSAVIVIQDPDNRGHYQLKCTYREGLREGEADNSEKSWAKFESHDDEISTFMEFNMFDIEGGSSYQLTIVASNAVDTVRVPKAYQEWAAGITFDLAKAQDLTHSDRFFNAWNKYGKTAVPIVSLQQKRSWQFNFTDSDYVVEVSTIQNIKLGLEPPEEFVRPYEARWAVELYHKQWDVWTAMNSTLETGRAAEWEPKEWFWFPPRGFRDKQDMEWASYDRGEGFKELMRKMKVVEGVIYGRDLGGGNDGGGDDYSAKLRRRQDRTRVGATPIRKASAATDEAKPKHAEATARPVIKPRPEIKPRQDVKPRPDVAPKPDIWNWQPGQKWPSRAAAPRDQDEEETEEADPDADLYGLD